MAEEECDLPAEVDEKQTGGADSRFWIEVELVKHIEDAVSTKRNAHARDTRKSEDTCQVVIASTTRYTANLHIVGTDGSILNDRFYLRCFREQKDFFTVDTGRRKSGDVSEHPFPELVDHFVQCLKEDRDSDHNVASAVNSHLACFAICRSAAAGGAWVEVPTGDRNEAK